MTGTLSEIWRYPVKSLSGDRLDSIEAMPGKRLPEDRRFAIVKGSGTVQPGVTAWASKRSFYNLMADEKLATLDARFDAEEGILTLERDGRQVARGKVTEPLGRMLIDQFLSAFLGATGAAPKIVESAGGAFTDVEEPYISLINLASVKDLERVLGKTADPRRFRGNLLLEGPLPWVERNWVGKRLRIGEVEMSIDEPIERCAATEVDPDSGRRDLPVLKSLARGFAHLEMGVYARIEKGGRLNVGDPLEIIG